MNADEEYDSDKKEKMRELISQKLKKEKGAERGADPSEEEQLKKSSRRYDWTLQYDFLFYSLIYQVEGLFRNHPTAHCFAH